MASSELIGVTFPEWRFPVDWSKVWEFAQAAHDDHRDGQDLPVPPTFPDYGLCAFETQFATRYAAFDMDKVLHAEEEFEYIRPLRVGDVLRCQTRIVDEWFKEGRRMGTLRFIKTETEMRDEKTGELVCIGRTTMVQTRAGEGE